MDDIYFQHCCWVLGLGLRVILISFKLMGLPTLIMLILASQLHLCLAEGEGEGEGEQKSYLSAQQERRLSERKKIVDVAIYSSNFQTYTFKLHKSSEFLLKPQDSQVLRATFEIYWNDKGVYVGAEVVEEQEVRLLVENRDTSNILASDVFTTGTGVAFNATKGITYRIYLRENGTREKIVTMRVSETFAPSNTTAKREPMQGIEERLAAAEQKIKGTMQAVEMWSAFESKITHTILEHSTAFGRYSILEAVLVLVVSCLQVKLITSLLKTDIVI